MTIDSYNLFFECLESYKDVEYLNEGINLATEDINHLERLNSLKINNGRCCQKLTELSVENICSRLGVKNNKTTTSISNESIIDFISNIWKAIINSFKRMFEFIKKIFGFSSNTVDNSTTKLKQVEDEINKNEKDLNFTVSFTYEKTNFNVKDNLNKIIEDKRFLDICYRFHKSDDIRNNITEEINKHLKLLEFVKSQNHTYVDFIKNIKTEVKKLNNVRIINDQVEQSDISSIRDQLNKIINNSPITKTNYEDHYVFKGKTIGGFQVQTDDTRTRRIIDYTIEENVVLTEHSLSNIPDINFLTLSKNIPSLNKLGKLIKEVSDVKLYNQIIKDIEAIGDSIIETARQAGFKNADLDFTETNKYYNNKQNYEEVKTILKIFKNYIVKFVILVIKNALELHYVASNAVVIASKNNKRPTNKKVMDDAIAQHQHNFKQHQHNFMQQQHNNQLHNHIHNHMQMHGV